MPLRSLLRPRVRRYVSGEATWKSPLGLNQSPISACNWKNARGLRRCWRTFQRALSMCPPTTSTPKLLTHSAAFASAPGLTSPRSGSSRPGIPRHFRADSLLSISGGSGSRPHVAERRRPGEAGSSAYKPTQVHRESVMTFEKGKPVSILDDPQGTTWVMQEFWDIVDSNLTNDQWEKLGGHAETGAWLGVPRVANLDRELTIKAIRRRGPYRARRDRGHLRPVFRGEWPDGLHHKP